MKVIIIEDENPAAKRLAKLLEKYRPGYELIDSIESVEDAVKFFKTTVVDPDLIFMDIQLADGLSFDIFDGVEVKYPVVFTTAYDQYVLKAFKVNSIDYLLKPIDEEELEFALDKFDRLKTGQNSNVLNVQLLEELKSQMQAPATRKRFLIKSGQQISYLPTEQIRYFFSNDGLVYAKTTDGKKFLIDYTLDQLEGLVDVLDFFRISRKFLIHIDSIRKIHPYFNSRLKLDLKPEIDLEVIVSRDRVSNFKKWLDS